MTTDKPSGVPSVPCGLSDDEIFDDNSGAESFDAAVAVPAAPARRIPATPIAYADASRQRTRPADNPLATIPYFFGIAVAMALAFWAVTSDLFVPGPGGQGGLGNNAALAAGVAEPFPVTVQASTARGYIQTLTLNGHTEAGARLAVKAETAGVVDTVLARKGGHVEKGDILCALQQGARDAALAEANAQLMLAQLDIGASTKLAELGIPSQPTLAGSKASLDAAEAAVRKAEFALNHTRIVAPFSGIVEDLPARMGELLNAGSICAVLVALDPLFVVGAVTEREVGQLQRGMEGVAQLATGEKVGGTIHFVGSAAEKTTRTFRVEMEVPNPDGRLRDGVTATMRIPLKSETAHRLPPSALTLNDAGELGVRVVAWGELAQFHPVKVISDEPGEVWVSGLPREARVIVVGQDFVTDGQHVSLWEKRAPPSP